MAKQNSTVKAAVSVLTVGHISFEVLMLPDGSFAIAVPQVADLFQIAKDHASRDIKDLMGNGFEFEKVFSELHPKSVNTLSIDDFKKLANILAVRGNKKAQEFLGIEQKSRSVNLVRTEKEIQLKLQQKLGGEIEIECLAGRIDLLTSTQIIEVKNVGSWKSALGQILVYGEYYPSHQKRIHLYGETQASYLELIRKHCSKFSVVVTHQIK